MGYRVCDEVLCMRSGAVCAMGYRGCRVCGGVPCV